MIGDKDDFQTYDEMFKAFEGLDNRLEKLENKILNLDVEVEV